MNPRIFPIIMMVLNLGASIVYFCDGNPKRGIYWLAALTLNACITF